MHTHKNGFTLIELSIVLVIIGLIVGGILTGQSLIAAATVRAQITQIEKYNSAANTFYGKYGYLPGDIPAAPAKQFGFASRGSNPGEGDGNGLIQSYDGNGLNCIQFPGETAMFWVDLSTAHLIDGGFSTATAADINYSSTTTPSLYFPAAAIGNGAYVTVWCGDSNTPQYMGKNLFGIYVTYNSSWSYFTPGPETFTVQQAYNIDRKVDDGLPQSGNAEAIYSDAGTCRWSTFSGASTQCGDFSSRAAPGTSTSCFDNRNVAGAVAQYSTNQNNGAGVNCAMTFVMQAGD